MSVFCDSFTHSSFNFVIITRSEMERKTCSLEMKEKEETIYDTEIKMGKKLVKSEERMREMLTQRMVT